MHCPSCGQEQVSANTKFCSRCGFQLDLVAELLSNGGFLPQLAQLAGNKTFFNKKNGVMFAVLWFFTFIFILAGISAVLNLDEIVPIFGILGVFGSLLILIISLVYLPSSKPAFNIARTVNPASMPAGLFNRQDRPGLPPEQSIPATAYTAPQGNWRAPDTGELATPGTVTEGTTKLLSREENN